MNRAKGTSISTLQVSEDIVAIGDLKAHLSEKIRELRGRGRPFIVTQNGKVAAVLPAPEDFDRLTSQAQFIAAVQEGLDNLAAGRVVSNVDLARRLDARFGPLTKPK